MASDVDVCNMALSHLGSDAQVAAINPPDGSVEAGHCRRFFTLARQEALEMAAYSWTKRRATLALVDNPSTIWTYAYALPSDCIRPLRVLQLSTANFSSLQVSAPASVDDLNRFYESGTANFDIEGRVLLTHEPDAVLLYVRDVTDPSNWSPSFVSGLSFLLASFLAGPLVKGEPGAKASQRLRDAAGSVLRGAQVLDASRNAEQQDFTPSALAVR